MDLQTFFNYNVTNIIFSVVFGLGVISGLFIAYTYIKRKPLKDDSNLLAYDNPEWKSCTDIPCPGSLIVCEDSKHKLYFGYAVAHNDHPALLQIPSLLTDYKGIHLCVTPESIYPIPVAMFQRWTYMERRILPVETLRTYAQQYKE